MQLLRIQALIVKTKPVCLDNATTSFGALSLLESFPREECRGTCVPRVQEGVEYSVDNSLRADIDSSGRALGTAIAVGGRVEVIGCTI